jgi:phage terminase large subunit-like protein
LRKASAPSARTKESGIVLGGQEQEGQGGVVAQGFERVLERAPGGAAACGVAVEAEHDAVGLAQQGVDVLRRGRGA